MMVSVAVGFLYIFICNLLWRLVSVRSRKLIFWLFSISSLKVSPGTRLLNCSRMLFILVLSANNTPRQQVT
jgi:hypothetical protein